MHPSAMHTLVGLSVLVPAPWGFGCCGDRGYAGAGPYELWCCGGWLDNWGAGEVLGPAPLLGGGQLGCRVTGWDGDGDEESDGDDEGECDDDGDVWKR